LKGRGHGAKGIGYDVEGNGPGDGDQVSGVRKQIMEFGSGEAESKESMGRGQRDLNSELSGIKLIGHRFAQITTDFIFPPGRE
jgi:hypothetical protein